MKGGILIGERLFTLFFLNFRDTYVFAYIYFPNIDNFLFSKQNFLNHTHIENANNINLVIKCKE